MAHRLISRVAMLASVALLSGALVLGATGASAASRPTVAKAAVKIQNYTYLPATLTVAKGTKVTWTNDDGTPHLAVFSKFGSPTLGTGKSWSHKFTKPGTFKYFCTLHPEMRGKVVVTG